MKSILLVAILLFTIGCAETISPPERSISAAYDASGLGANAYVGMTTNSTGADIVFEPSQTTSSRVTSAPEQVCQYLNATVLSVENQTHPSPQYYPTARVLEIKCST